MSGGKQLILRASLLLNILFLVFVSAFVQHKGGLSWLGSKLLTSEQKQLQIPSLPLPNVHGRILMIGDSHLAIHPWAEYLPLPFSNRAVSGSRIKDIRIEEIKGNPALVLVSTSTNDLQITPSSTVEEIKESLKELFSNIKTKWPNSVIVFISAPYPNVEIYEQFIRAKYPQINRPMPEQIDAISSFVESQGIITIKAKSANIDGLHIDLPSAFSIAERVSEIYSNQLLREFDKDH